MTTAHHSSWMFGDPATPILKAYIGDEIFDAIARDYIDAHPSVFRNVRWFGGHLADFRKPGVELIDDGRRRAGGGGGDPP